MKTTRSVLLLFALLLLAPVAHGQDDDGKDGEKTEKKEDGKDGDKKEDDKRKVDTTSPEAQALSELLSIAPNYGKDDKRVELVYPFDGSGGMDDFESRGFDKSGLGLGDGGLNGGSANTLFLAIGSRRQGMLLHALALKDPYEIEWELRVGAIAADTQLVFVFANGKAGGILGPYFAKRTRRGFKPVVKVRKLDSSHITHQLMKVKYKVEDGVITCWVNGRKFKESKKLNGKLDGRVGIFASNLNLWIERLTIKGQIDASKL